MQLKAILFLVILLTAGSAYSAECPASRYEELVTQAKSADEAREWERATELYSSMVADCQASIPAPDLPKAYDALSSAQLMLNKYQEALENSQKCIDLDSRYNACMMTAARVHEALGDKERAVESARNAAAVEPFDDYSAAVAILANSFLRRYQQK
jgi:tetratricopeptide (TPR) repeat protein